MTTYLLDTDTISALMSMPAHKRRQNIEAWLRSLGDGAVVLSSVSISEINRGIALLETRNPAASVKIRHALSRIMAAYEDAIITPSHAEWQIFAEMSAVPELKHLCRGKNKKDQPRTGADIFLAAQANTLACAIATMNVDDFLLVDRHFPLVGGIIDPSSGVWVREPDALQVSCGD